MKTEKLTGVVALAYVVLIPVAAIYLHNVIEDIYEELDHHAAGLGLDSIQRSTKFRLPFSTRPQE